MTTQIEHIEPRQMEVARRKLAKGATLNEAATACGVTAATLDLALWRSMARAAQVVSVCRR